MNKENGYILDIPQPDTHPYLVLSITSFFFAVVSLFPSPVLGASLAALGLFAALAKAGIEVDPKNNRIRYYKRIGNTRWGMWRLLSSIKMIELTGSKNSDGFFGLGGGPAGFSGAGFAEVPDVHCYNLVLENHENKKEEWHEFVDYGVARKTLVAIWKHLSIPCHDRIQEARKSAIARRRR